MIKKMEKRKNRDKIIQEKKKSAIAKLVFLSILILLVLIVETLVSMQNKSNTGKKQEKKAEQENSKEEKEIEKDIQEKVKGIIDEAEEIRIKGEDEYRNFLKKNTSELEKKAGEILYEKTLRPFIDKFKNLPEDQQNYIKDEICEPQTSPIPTPQGAG